MRYTFPQVIFGFHGCDRSVGEAVLAGKTRLKSSKNTYDWLGSGVYFWENAPQRAMQWAQDCVENPKKSCGKIKEPFVIGAIINVGNCLNLTASEDQGVLEAAYAVLTKTLAVGKLQLNNTEAKRDLDCCVINTAVQMQKLCKLESFDTVRGAFVEGKPIYPDARLFTGTHIQICVRNPRCICGYFRPSEFIQP